MIEAVMLWNEPNNLSHWDFELDPTWSQFAAMTRLAGAAVHAEAPGMRRVLGGISPIDPAFIRTLAAQGGLDEVDAVAVHGFPLDWNHWQIDEWPAKLDEIRSATNLPIWVSEVGVSSFGAEEVQEFGLRRTADLLSGRADRIHWYSLFDLPRAWPATTRHREAEGSSYYRHFYMGLVREDGTPKRALRHFAELAPELGLCQWIHFEDHRLDALVGWLQRLGVRRLRTGLVREDGTPKRALRHFAELAPELGLCQWIHFEDHRLDALVGWLQRLGVRRLRTGLSWADSGRPGADAWFDRQMRALEPFDVTVTFCFTPEADGLRPHHTSPPKDPRPFADFCARMIRRYAG